MRLYNSQHHRDALQRLRTTEWGQRIITYANTGGGVHDRVHYQALAHRMTGEIAYAEAIWTPGLRDAVYANEPITQGNVHREYGIDGPFLFDTILPLLTEDDKQAWARYFLQYADQCLLRHPLPHLVRLADSDETVGIYMALALIKIVLEGIHPRADTLLSEGYNDPDFGSVIVGQFDATGADHRSMRNAIAWYAQACPPWIESSQYNQGTLALLFLGVSAINAFTGRDCFPEITSKLPGLAEHHFQQLHSTLTGVKHWGDVEGAALDMRHRQTLTGIMAGFPEFGWNARLSRLAQDFIDLGPGIDYGAALTPYARMFLTGWDGSAGEPWRETLPRYQSVGGLQITHSTWQADDVMHVAHWPDPFTGVDHSPLIPGNFEIVSRGEQILPHAPSYLGESWKPYGSMGQNVAYLYGVNMCDEAKRLLYEERIGDISALCGTTAGINYQQTGAGCNRWIQENTRTLVLADGVRIIHQRLHVQDPRTTPGYENLDAEMRATIEASDPAVLVFRCGNPVDEVFGIFTAHWETPNNQLVDVECVYGCEGVALRNEAELPMRGIIADLFGKQFQFQVPTVGSSLYVVQHGVMAEPFELRTNTRDVRGCIVGTNAFLFSDRPSIVRPTHRNAQGYLIHDRFLADRIFRNLWISEDFDFDVPAGTRVYLSHLNPELQWFVNEQPMIITAHGTALLSGQSGTVNITKVGTVNPDPHPLPEIGPSPPPPPPQSTEIEGTMRAFENTDVTARHEVTLEELQPLDIRRIEVKGPPGSGYVWEWPNENANQANIDRTGNVLTFDRYPPEPSPLMVTVYYVNDTHEVSTLEYRSGGPPPPPPVDPRDARIRELEAQLATEQAAHAQTQTRLETANTRLRTIDAQAVEA